MPFGCGPSYSTPSRPFAATPSDADGSRPLPLRRRCCQGGPSAARGLQYDASRSPIGSRYARAAPDSRRFRPPRPVAPPRAALRSTCSMAPLITSWRVRRRHRAPSSRRRGAPVDHSAATMAPPLTTWPRRWRHRVHSRLRRRCPRPGSARASLRPPAPGSARTRASATARARTVSVRDLSHVSKRTLAGIPDIIFDVAMSKYHPDACDGCPSRNTPL